MKPLLLLLTLSVFVFACDDESDPEQEPIVSTFVTLDPVDVQYINATLRGKLRYRSSEHSRNLGIVWGTNPQPNFKNGNAFIFTEFGVNSQPDTLTRKVLGLKVNTTYFYRTFIISGTDTTYGDEISFKTRADVNNDFFDFPGKARSHAISFVINGKGYFGLGSYYSPETNDQIILSDFWEVDLTTRAWTRKKDLAGLHGAVSFVIGEYGYVGTGEGVNGLATDKFYRYNPTTDDWTGVSDYPGGKVMYASAFTINGKGYVGTGMTDASIMLTDFYEFDPASGWKKKANYTGTPVGFAMGFAIGDKGYIGLGSINGLDFTTQLCEYNVVTNQWTIKKYIPVDDEVRSPVAFVIDGKGYFGLGGFDTDETIWVYDPVTNSVTKDGEFKAFSRIGAAVFQLTDRAIIGSGNSDGYYDKTFVQYFPGN
jgi:hypothetical protein